MQFCSLGIPLSAASEYCSVATDDISPLVFERNVEIIDRLVLGETSPADLSVFHLQINIHNIDQCMLERAIATRIVFQPRASSLGQGLAVNDLTDAVSSRSDNELLIFRR